MQQLDTHARHASGPESLLTKGAMGSCGGNSGSSPAHDRAPPKKAPPSQPAVEVRHPKPLNGPAGDAKKQQQKSADEESIDYDSSLENTSVSSFDFNRDIGGQQQRAVGMGTLYKAGPSKWEDAEKWLSSDRNSKPKMQQLVSSIPSHVIINASKKAALLGRMGIGLNGSGGVLDFLSEPDPSNMCTKKVDAVARFSFMPSPGNGGVAPPAKARSMSSLDRYPLEELLSCEGAEGTAVAAGRKLKVVSTLCDTDEDMSKPAIGRTEKPTCDSDHRLQEPGKMPSAEPCAAPPPGLRSVSMRDMGTEMTPIASQEPSRTGTPLRATTPTIRSPVCSGPSTPSRLGGRPLSHTQSQSLPEDAHKEVEAAALSEKQLQASKTRQEILALGTQLGKANIAAWASREEEEEDASRCLKNVDLGEVKKNVVEARAASWEEAEQAKYEARYKREEAKIIAWENHERAKAEAEMKRIEVKVERMRSHAHEQLMNKLACARRRAEELRALAESRLVDQAAKTAERADYIRQTGSLPPASLSSSSSSPLTALLRLCC